MSEDEEIDADRDAVEGVAPPSSRVRLSREVVVAGAVELIDADGLADLSMRVLATRLGAEAMSLYRHVQGREDLLDAVVDRVVDQMYDDPDVLSAPEFGWQDFLQRLAHGVRRVALAHPKVFPLVAARPPEAPWLRPPLRNLEWVEIFLQGLRSEGFDAEASVEAYRAFTSFLLGHLLLEVAGHGADLGPLDVLSDGVEPGLSSYPMVQELRGPLSEDHSAAEFEASLENLLDRLELVRVRHRG